MPAKRVIYIIAATIIALFLIHKCSDSPQRDADRAVTVQEAKDDVAIDDPASPDEKPVQPKQPEQPEQPEQEDVQMEKPFVLLTPPPELIELKPPDAPVIPAQKEDTGALVYRPAPELKSVGDESFGAALEDVEADGAAQKASTAGMVLVQDGCFVMGNHKEDAFEGETPAHEVCLDAFYMDMREVIQKEFMEVMGSNPSRFEGAGLPVESVRWHKASQYCRLVGKRLPTEAEWEYAAHSEGVDDFWAGTSDPNELKSFAWTRANSSARPHEPGSLRPNAIGLYDMSGNLREWVSDWYNEHYYAESPIANPAGSEEGVDKVLRGGSWDDLPRYNRVSYRVRLNPSFKNSRNGFRCAVDAEGAGR